MLKYLVLFFALSLLSSCGFHLKGHSPEAANSITQLALHIKKAPPALQQSLRNTLANNNVELNTQSVLQLTINDYALKERNLSLEKRDQAIERELLATVKYQTTLNGKVSVQKTVQARVIYSADPLAALSSDRERRALEQQLMQQLSQNILRALNHQQSTPQ